MRCSDAKVVWVVLALTLAVTGCVGPLRGRYVPSAYARRYKVRRGDTVYAIARRFQVTPNALAQSNGIDNPRALRPGMVLRVPRRARDEATSAAPKPPTALARTTPKRVLVWPLQGVLTSNFGRRLSHSHDGIDIGAPRGTPVRAAAAGEVMFASHHGGYGNVVIIRHVNDLVTVYAHHDVNLVSQGQRVHVGQTIAKVGASGRATGPHLHFEVRHGTRPRNPLLYLPS